MFASFGWGELAVVAGVFGILLLKFAVVLGLAYWLLSKTGLGRRWRHAGDRQAGGVTLEIADQLRGMQVQLEELHARVDFAERVLVEQREQLHALGIEPPRNSPLPTPV